MRFYAEVLGCRFRYLMPGFFPGDAATGGHHVICVKDLAERRGLLA